MKRIYALLPAIMTVQMIFAQYISVGQYNVRYDSSDDAKKGNGWEQRAPKIVALIQYEDWDVIGMQEVLHSQLNDLQGMLDEYGHVGVGRSDGATKGEYSPIFYKKSRLRCLNHGTFWFSPTPDVAGSKGWDAAFPRICTWAQFEDKITRRHFWMFNLHLDHVGKQARSESAKILLRRIEEICGDDPYVLTGDFNVDEKSEVYVELLQSGKLLDAYDVARYRMAENGTTNSFNPDRKSDARIDHIFVSPHFEVRNYGILTHCYWARVNGSRYEAHTLSDHYPVSARMKLPCGEDE